MIDFFKGLLFARRCIVCGETLSESAEQVFCPRCRSEYEAHKEKPCSDCHKPHAACTCLPKKLSGKVLCGAHLFAFGDSFSKSIIYTLKHRDFRPLFRFLGQEMAELVRDFGDADLTYAPRKPKSVREYGFDQAKRLADEMGKILHCPVIKLFRHARRSALQKNLNAAERAENAEKSFSLGRFAISGKTRLIIVDDVMTTGSTMAKLISLAKDVGYTEIMVVCVARTVQEKEMT